MSKYVIGDIQGCLSGLQALLKAIDFSPQDDTLYFAGDLVNRGPESLGVLHFVKSLGDSAECVLGNHDLHLLAVHAGYRKTGRKDTIDDILEAPDRLALMDWLRQLPLMITLPDRQQVICHAGLCADWDLETAEAEARFVENHLRRDTYRELFADMYGNTPTRWKPGRNTRKRLRFAINCFTRMRYCDGDGALEFEQKGKPGTQPPELMPWYQVPGRKHAALTIYFGHWSTIGESGDPKAIALDTGCVWGGRLTAFDLETGQLISVPCDSQQKPG
ncbi:MAG TPA: diadenosine tetraphosphatase [Gammaproteobacteria bacterium]|jgi:bis(5'-nucleosyl)-tetraphosphatase (symmetrical)|nr:diadenosine tetraphosphatase [Gammaproteobacteria bacterium]